MAKGERNRNLRKFAVELYEESPEYAAKRSVSGNGEAVPKALARFRRRRRR
jgi:hypothetical protein